MAFILEPVVGAALGGVPSVPGYLKAMREICLNCGVLLIFGPRGRNTMWYG